MDNVSFGYFIVKPDGAKNIDNILNDVEDKFSDDMIRYYKIDDFENVVNNLYYKHFEEKGDKLIIIPLKYTLNKNNFML